jgi:DNA-binding NarL/FixJ family response regulator
MIRVGIADDDALIRESLEILLGAHDDLKIVGSVANGEEAIELAKRGVDVMLLDLRMPVMSGIEALPTLCELTKVLVLSTFDEAEGILEALRRGAMGYLLKSTPPSGIAQAIRLAYAGQSTFDEAAMEVLRGQVPQSSDARRVDLTPREEDVVKLVAKGMSNRQIAESLFLTEGTVKNYISSILEKAELSHRTQIAVAYLKGEIKL